MPESYSLSNINPKLLRRIYRACRPSLVEPNLQLNLEICDFVNAKQGLAPRDAAICVAKLISQRDPQTSELAIALLDNLVKNCGYPFHLQISRKEFLNELVKRFPERPPPRYSREQRLVLQQIEEWYQTICRTSKYKDDFKYIKDMHRLLSNKGYVFPEVNIADASVLNPTDNLKLLEELHREEAIVHSAKLQELIRRGRPQDLQEANRLMKIMAGFKEDQHEQHRKQVNDDVARLRRKVEILAEMLNSAEAAGATINGDQQEALVELYASVKSSQPIIAKIIEEEQAENSDDARVAELLQLNDTVNMVVEKYQLLKSGNTGAAAAIKVSGGAAGKATAADLNLIDFDDGDDGNDAAQDKQGYTDLLHDLANLSFPSNGGAPAGVGGSSGNGNGTGNDIFGTGGLIALGSLLAQTVQPASSLDPFGMAFPSRTPAPVQASGNSSSDQSSLVICQLEHVKIAVQTLPASTAEHFYGRVLFSNTQQMQVSAVKFLVAAPKSCKLMLKPQLGDTMYGYAANAITQDLDIANPMHKTLKIKYKVEYVINGVQTTETGLSTLI